MSTNERAAARTNGVKLAARVATIGGLAVAALGLAGASAARASTPAHASADDAQTLPMETWAKAAQGGCGCGPCWGPPAPPAKTARGAA